MTTDTVSIYILHTIIISISIVISLLAGTHSAGIAGAVGTIRDIMDGTILTIAPITTIFMVTIILVT